jgi:hypothetical protein
MATKTDICNIALMSLKSATVTNIETDKTTGGIACNLFYDSVLKSLLEQYNWSFAQTRTALRLSNHPTSDEWGFAYSYPVDAVKIIEIDSVAGNVVPFEIGYGSQSTIILTNKQNATAVYTKFITDSSRFPALFSMSLSYKLASAIATSVCDGDLFNLGAIAEQKYLQTVSHAISSSKNEFGAPPETVSSMVSSRL